jgi:dUTPase
VIKWKPGDGGIWNGPAFGKKNHKPWRWIESTKELQTEAYGADPGALIGDAWADFVTWNCAALLCEVGEFMREVGWKPWAINRGWMSDKALEELVDVGHFLGNLLAALHVTDEQWEAAYRRKQQKNRDRMASQTYDGRNDAEE